MGVFGRSYEECPECHTVLKSGSALNSHRGSRPCQLEQTIQQMEERDWKCAGNPSAEDIFILAGVTFEKAPAAYRPGGMLGVVKGKTLVKAIVVDKETHQHRKRRQFVKPNLADGIWAPAWAVTIVDAPGFDGDERVRILEWAQAAQRHVDELLAAIALGGIEVLSAYTQTKAFRETENT